MRRQCSASSSRLSLASSSARYRQPQASPASLAHEADWIGYAGVAIAFVGVLTATPDGVSEVAAREPSARLPYARLSAASAESVRNRN